MHSRSYTMAPSRPPWRVHLKRFAPLVVFILAALVVAACGSKAAPTPNPLAGFNEAQARALLIDEVNKVCAGAKQEAIDSGLSLARKANAAEEGDHWKFAALDPVAGIYLAEVYRTGEVTGSLVGAITTICTAGISTTERTSVRILRLPIQSKVSVCARQTTLTRYDRLSAQTWRG